MIRTTLLAGTGVIAVLGLGVLRPAAAEPPVYVAVPTQSSLTFIGTQQGERFTGVIRDFDARVTFAPEQLATSRIDVTMRLKSMSTGNAERDAALGDPAWFDFAHAPTATFRSTAMRPSAGGATADADLVIKGRSKHLLFPFTFRASGATATLDARVTLDRLDFAVGGGEWADDSVVGRKCDVVVHLVLAPAAPSTHATPRSP